MASPFLKLFGKSPFRPLSDHIETAYHCVAKLEPFFEAAFQQNWDEAKKYQHEINELEHKADELKRHLRLNLPKNLFLPVARGDLLELISYQDHLANETKDIAGLMIGRKMILPDTMQQPYMELLKQSIAAAKQAFKAIRELHELYEGGFGGKELAIIEEMIERLHDIEHDTDKRQAALRLMLFKMEDELPPVNVIFLYNLFQWTGLLADHAQIIGDRLQICIAR
jgi:uncharacterized protein